jgi:hypothetical protein
MEGHWRYHYRRSKQLVMTLDHDVQNKSEKNLTKYKTRSLQNPMVWTSTALAEEVRKI